MIYVRVELWKRGNPDNRRLMGELFIRNTGTGTRTTGTYTYELRGAGRTRMNEGSVIGFPRLRLHAWDLVQRVLMAAERG
jgi:hypothetical protein